MNIHCAKWMRLILGCLICTATHAGDSPVQSLDSVAMTVGELEMSRTFYEQVLNFTFVSDTEVSGEPYEHLYGVFGVRLRTVTLQLGAERLQLQQFIAPRGRPFPADSSSNDRWFQHVAVIVSDMDRAYVWLREHKVTFASTGPQVLPPWNAQAAGIAAFYFRDPDGHYLEVLHFPKDKGDPKWQKNPGQLFLGIDHTAIVVADTEASLRFYRDTLGMRVVGASENFGTEQEHLNNVFGARLRITALRAARGPGVEFLDYRAPGDGRPMPRDTHSNDLWNWQVRLRTGEADEASAGLRSGRAQLVSPGVIALPEQKLGFRK